jgi:hypothetical protein
MLVPGCNDAGVSVVGGAKNLRDDGYDTRPTLSSKVLRMLGPSAQERKVFPLCYKDLGGRLHFWVECCLPNGQRGL